MLPALKTEEYKKQKNGGTVLLKCLLAALPLAVFIALFLFFPMRFFDSDYPDWRWQKDFLTDESVQADVLFLGDSLEVSGVMAAQWGENAYNIGLPGTTAVEMRYALETYLEHHDAPKLVIMGYGQNHFIEMNCYWIRTAYFHYLPISEQVAFIRQAAGLGDMAVFGDVNVLGETLAYGLYAPDRCLPALLNMIEEKDRPETNRTAYAGYAERHGYLQIGMADSCSDASASVAYDSFVVAPAIDARIREIAQLCEDNGIRLVVERPPCNRATMDATGETFAAEYEDYLTALAADYPGMIVNTQIEVYPDDCFGDPGHLNARGAERYTQSLIARYKSLAE